MTSNKMLLVSQAYGSIPHIMARRKGYFDSYNYSRACYLPFEHDRIMQQDDFLSVEHVQDCFEIECLQPHRRCPIRRKAGEIAGRCPPRAKSHPRGQS